MPGTYRRLSECYQDEVEDGGGRVDEDGGNDGGRWRHLVKMVMVIVKIVMKTMLMRKPVAVMALTVKCDGVGVN